MMVSPVDAADLAKRLRKIYADAEEQLAARIGRNLAKGIDAPDWAERQLASVRTIRRDTAKMQRSVAAAADASLVDSIRTAYRNGVAMAGADIAGLTGVAFGGVDPHAMDALVASQKGLRGSLQQAGLKIASEAGKAYATVVHEVTGRMLTGTVTRREATAQAVGKLLRKGITQFTDKRGRNWDLGSYAEMATRTAAGHAAVQGHMDRLQESGQDLVQVSDAPEECRLCRPWEGQVLSISGNTPTGRQTINGHTVDVAGSVRQAEGDGLFHPNCRHRTMIYVPGRSTPMHDTADPEGDQLRQEQRRRERRIRDLRRQVAALEPLGDTPQLREARGKLRGQVSDFAAWRKQHGRKDLDYRTRSPKAPGIDRLTASDLQEVDGDDLAEALNAAYVADDMTLADRLGAELDRRDRAAAALEERRARRKELRNEKEAQVSAATGRLVMEDGMPPVRAEIEARMEVLGEPRDKAERAVVRNVLRVQYGEPNGSYNDLLTRAFKDRIAEESLAAENATRGHMFSAAGERSAKSQEALWMVNERTARAHASPEVLEWWDEHGRFTREQLLQELIDGRADRFHGEDFYR